MSQKIIGLVGLIGSGKGTVASYLVKNQNFINISFAAHLKDAVACVFRWPRHMLEGDTNASREWREQVDTWWANRLNLPHLTPRWILQNWGTDVLRLHFHDDIWIASLEHRLLEESTSNFIISDVRFPNEVKMIQKLQGEIWKIERGPQPEWATLHYENFADLERHMTVYYPNIHSSEWSWIISKFNKIIKNDNNINELYKEIDKCLAVQTCV